jgi:hypothetical protein
VAAGVALLESSAALDSQASSVCASLQNASPPDPAQSQQSTELLGAASQENVCTVVTRIIGPFDLTRRDANSECWLWYPYWFAAVYLLDTAEVLAEEFPGSLGEAAVAAEVQALAACALHILSFGPLHKYRCATANGPQVLEALHSCSTEFCLPVS